MTTAKAKKTILFSILGVLFVLLLTFVIIFIAKKNNLTDYEKLTFERESAKITNYLEAIDNDLESHEDQQIDKYLTFALLYANGEEGKNKLSVEEIQQIIESHFDIETDTHRLDVIGLTPTTSSFKILKNDDGKFKLDTTSDAKTISRTPITKYLLKDVSKTKNGFTAKYVKYRADDPYKIFNYASDNKIDVPGAGAYLNGSGNANSLKSVITLNNVDELATFEKELTITYILKDGNLVLQTIN